MNEQNFMKYFLDTFFDYYIDIEYHTKLEDIYVKVTKCDNIYINTTEKILIFKYGFDSYSLDISGQLDYLIREERDRKLNEFLN